MTVDAQDPYAAAVCDGCSFWVRHRDLQKHMVYRGGITPMWDGLLFCTKCQDIPNPAPQFSRLKLYPDPVPVENPRVQVPTPTLSGYGYLVTETGEMFNTLTNDDTWGGEFIATIPATVYP